MASVLALAQPPSGLANTNMAPSRSMPLSEAPPAQYRWIRSLSVTLLPGGRAGTFSQYGAPATSVAPSSDTARPMPKFTAPSPVPAAFLSVPSALGALTGPGVSVASGELSLAQPPSGFLNT